MMLGFCCLKKRMVVLLARGIGNDVLSQVRGKPVKGSTCARKYKKHNASLKSDALSFYPVIVSSAAAKHLVSTLASATTNFDLHYILPPTLSSLYHSC